MRHAFPILLIWLAAAGVAAILLPSDPWTHHFGFRTVAIGAIAIVGYCFGLARGKTVTTEGRKRRWVQFSLRTLLVVTILLAICLGLYCGRVRQQRKAVESLSRIDECVLYYDDGLQPYQEELAQNPSYVSSFLEDKLGCDFVHKAVRVIIYPEDVERALPDLKRLPYLQCVSVCLGREPELMTDEAAEVYEKRQTERRESQRRAIERLNRELPHIRVESYDNEPDCQLVPVVG